MARIRTIKPEFWTSEQVVNCRVATRLFFIGLWNFCDDSGVCPANIKRLKMQIFPGDTMDDATLEAMVLELKINGLLLTYSWDNKHYLRVTGWQHQRIDRPTFRFPLEDGHIPPSPLTRSTTKKSTCKKTIRNKSSPSPLPNSIDASGVVL